METLFNGFTLALSPGAFPLSTDSMVLADFVRLRPNAGVLDLGSGCGTLGLLLCAKNESCTVTGIELDPEAHAMALENAARNGIDRRLGSICADLRLLPSEIVPGSFSCCVSNPPYFSGGFASAAHPLARQEQTCTLLDVFAAASKSLRFGGDFFLVHKPERLGELCALGAEFDLIPKVLRLVRHTSGGSVSLLLLQMRKGAKQGLIFQEEALRDPEGHPTADYRRIYHLDEP